MKYSKMTWQEINSIEREKCLFVLPIGSCEQHGPHLPMDVDVEISLNLSKVIEDRFSSILLEPIDYACRSLPSSGGGYIFPATLYVKSNTFLSYIKDLIECLLDNGIRNLVVLNGHWENEACIFETIEQLREEDKLNDAKVLALSWWSLISSKEMIDIFGEFDNWSVEHAGQSETSLMMYFKPASVRVNKMRNSLISPPEGVYMYPIPYKWQGNNGVLSKIEHVKPDMGKKLFKLLEKKLTELIEEYFYD